MGLGTAQSVLHESNPTPDLLRAFLADIGQARVALRTHLADAYKGERVYFLAAMAEVLGMEELLPAPARSGARLSRSPMAWLGRPIGRSMVTGYLETVPRMVELGDADYVRAQPLIDALEADAANWRAHYLRHRSRILVAMVVPAWVRKAEARLAVAQVSFALRLYRAERGTYPESLGALTPAVLAEVPADPFTGKPLMYAREGDGFLLYSIGLNGADDGGLAETEEQGKKLNPGTDDIAWRVPRWDVTSE